MCINFKIQVNLCKIDDFLKIRHVTQKRCIVSQKREITFLNAAFDKEYFATNEKFLRLMAQTAVFMFLVTLTLTIDILQYQLNI